MSLNKNDFHLQMRKIPLSKNGISHLAHFAYDCVNHPKTTCTLPKNKNCANVTVKPVLRCAKIVENCCHTNVIYSQHCKEEIKLVIL